MIDIHGHVGKLIYGRNPITPENLIPWMDANGIEKTVVLPVASPEDVECYYLSEDALRDCRIYPDRLIPFCNLDPRHRSNDGAWDPYPIIAEYAADGCKGFGEVLACLKTDDARLKNIYRACGRLKIPVLAEFRGGNTIALQDELGMPRLEKMLQEFPETIFIAHGPGFWAEMCGAVTWAEKEVQLYPKGRVKTAGRVDYLLEKYANLYGDLSAGSGYSALSRDPEYAGSFLEKHRRKLLFGTDRIFSEEDAPIMSFLKNIGLAENTYRLIAEDNARKLLNI